MGYLFILCFIVYDKAKHEDIKYLSVHNYLEKILWVSFLMKIT